MRTLDYLDKLQPDAVAICGYATPDARACLRWCRRHRASAILMTETREQDGARVWWKEWIKARIVRSFDGALCGGSDARNYLEKLGMPAVRIAEGYDVVDNDYFATEAQKHRSTDPPVALYFLASGRFIERKNYGFLIEAYAAYVKRACSPTIDNRQPATATWNLCLLGDGEQKTDLIAHCHRLGLNVIEAAPWESNEAPSTKNQERNTVFFPGWRSHAELPRFYAHAGAFVHPAVSEPWGLVVNEAMASELPLLVSPGTGAVKSFFKEDCDQNLFSQDAQIASEQMLEISDAQHKPAEFDEAPWQTKLSENAHQSAFGRVLAELLLLLY
ncbi:MAG: glycosyltransferase family 4 protein [Verrucomicrobiales bacterium]|nr:glycosyltransferase family 4 protein [Verrucomicrobiales bacterium]